MSKINEIKQDLQDMEMIISKLKWELDSTRRILGRVLDHYGTLGVLIKIYTIKDNEIFNIEIIGKDAVISKITAPSGITTEYEQIIELLKKLDL